MVRQVNNVALSFLVFHGMASIAIVVGASTTLYDNPNPEITADPLSIGLIALGSVSMAWVLFGLCSPTILFKNGMICFFFFLLWTAGGVVSTVAWVWEATSGCLGDSVARLATTCNGSSGGILSIFSYVCWVPLLCTLFAICCGKKPSGEMLPTSTTANPPRASRWPSISMQFGFGWSSESES